MTIFLIRHVDGQLFWDRVWLPAWVCAEPDAGQIAMAPLTAVQDTTVLQVTTAQHKIGGKTGFWYNIITIIVREVSTFKAVNFKIQSVDRGGGQNLTSISRHAFLQ